jgi:hypothetical protein
MMRPDDVHGLSTGLSTGLFGLDVDESAPSRDNGVVMCTPTARIIIIP